MKEERSNYNQPETKDTSDFPNPWVLNDAFEDYVDDVSPDDARQDPITYDKTK